MSINHNPPLSGDCPTFEEALQNLEQIVHVLEEGQIGLAESLARYEDGVRLLKQCYGLLEGAERKIELLSGFDAVGNPVTVPFDDEPSVSRDEKVPAKSRRRSVPQASSALPDSPGALASKQFDETDLPLRELPSTEGGRSGNADLNVVDDKQMLF